MRKANTCGGKCITCEYAVIYVAMDRSLTSIRILLMGCVVSIICTCVVPESGAVPKVIIQMIRMEAGYGYRKITSLYC